MLSINPDSKQITSEDVVKIGVYEYEPYIYIEENGDIDIMLGLPISIMESKNKSIFQEKFGIFGAKILV